MILQISAPVISDFGIMVASGTATFITTFVGLLVKFQPKKAASPAVVIAGNGNAQALKDLKKDLKEDVEDNILNKVASEYVSWDNLDKRFIEIHESIIRSAGALESKLKLRLETTQVSLDGLDKRLDVSQADIKQILINVASLGASIKQQ